MNVIIRADYEEISREAANIISAGLKENPKTVLGLATGGTPKELYRRLVKEYKKGELDFSQATSFNLDEYVGLGSENKQSYRYFMEKHLFSHVNMKTGNIHVPDGLAPDPQLHCMEYERMIAKAGGIDFQLLGIGSDGHIGFNEPGSSLASRTGVVVLARETIRDNSRFFDSEDQVPRMAISMGLGTIMDARKCIMLASGENKAEAVRKCIEGPLCAMTPASVLQMHPDTTVIIDEAAACKLERRDYYLWLEKTRRKLLYN